MRELTIGEQLQVGDTLIAKTAFGTNVFGIDRVTKTMAVSTRKDGYEYKFKRVLCSNMKHPRRQWDMTTYTAIRGEE